MESTILAFIFGALAFLVAIAQPNLGLVLALVVLYFPLLPGISLGPIEFNAPMFPLAGLFLRAIEKRREGFTLTGWQRTLLFILALAFFLSLLFAESYERSMPWISNLLTYLLWLFVMMKLVRTQEQLWLLTRVILVLAFLLSIWRVELRPLRLLLGLPSLGINGAAFTFHPAVAMSIVFVTLPTRQQLIPRGWYFFSLLTLFSTVYHGFLYETRAAWLTWLVMMVVIGLQAPSRAKVVLVLIASLLLGLVFYTFADQIDANLVQTRVTVQGFWGEQNYSGVASDDLIRLLARDAGLRMFSERPLFGWGPGAYIPLKSLYINYSGKEGRLPGAFNAWVLVLAEWGIVGAGAVLITFLMPIVQSWRYRVKFQTLPTRLAFAYALGVFGLAIHLFFIDLLYSFTWAHVGLTLAASRLALGESSHV